jgi:hypothetical protein
MVEAHFLRKPGQSETDPATGDYRAGQYESWTRFELIDPDYRAVTNSTGGGTK